MTNEALPWLGFPPAVDLANTVMVTPAGELDLLEDEGQLRAWIAAEQGRIAGVEAASGRLTEVRALRETVRVLLHARARGELPPDEARRRVNAICASVPLRAALTDEGRAVEEPDARDPYALFEATVARSAIELADRDEDRLSVCGAPSCGMLFLRDHPRQVWCSKACGNRARVARHAARRR
jgi:predicted RNA-binding Zn ribbon-like protein